jgi:hypothetical protein
VTILEFVLLMSLLAVVIGTRWLDRRVAQRRRVRSLHPSSWPLESDGIPSREDRA